ncbi:MAG: 3-methyladenine DNA glycosylase AlkD [Myxococcota bacterium]|jgi:3-methyladenine DNA glycosylase AlkD
MSMSATAQTLIEELGTTSIKMGELKKRAKAIKTDHELALALWTSGAFFPRMLAVLVFDKKLLGQAAIDGLAADMLSHNDKERDQLADWLMANQLMKSKTLTALLKSWRTNPSPVLRRLFWYHQARLRWTGQASPSNTNELLDWLERDIATEEPVVQWAMNFCAGWLGIYQPALRSRCVAVGETTGLYKDAVVPRNCTPSYLPEFIRIEVEKRSG